MLMIGRPKQPTALPSHCRPTRGAYVVLLDLPTAAGVEAAKLETEPISYPPTSPTPTTSRG